MLKGLIEYISVLGAFFLGCNLLGKDDAVLQAEGSYMGWFPPLLAIPQQIISAPLNIFSGDSSSSIQPLSSPPYSDTIPNFPAISDDPELDTKNPKTPLSMQDAVDSALRGNLKLHFERFEPEKSEQNIAISRAVFEPEINFTFNYTDKTEAKAASTLDGSPAPVSQTGNYNFNVQQKFYYGTQVRLWTTSSRAETNSIYSTLNPDYGSGIGLDVTQPLLKGAGKTVNLAPITLAKSYKKESDILLRKQILDTILNAEIAYWNLAAAYAFKDLRNSNLKLAQKLLEENRTKHGVGVIRRQDVLQAEANLALAEEQMILAQQLIDQNNDELLGTFGHLEFDNNPKFIVAVLPQNEIEVPDFKRVIFGALAFDLDLQIALELIERRKLERAVAEDNVNPLLNLRAGASVLGREGEYADAYKNAFEGKGNSWSVGLDFSMPWGFKEERARRTRSELDLRQSQVNLAGIRQDLMLSLRLAYRGLEAGIESRSSAGRTLALNMESFDQQKALNDAGLSTFRDVLQAQRDLDESKRRYLDAVYAVIIAQAKLSRLDGSILRQHGFNWGTLGEYELTPTNEEGG